MFAAPRLFGQTMPIQSAGVSGSGCLQHHAYSVKRCLFNLLE